MSSGLTVGEVSFLRPKLPQRVGIAVLAGVVLALVAVPVAAATTPSPDPSPAGVGLRPDAYPTPAHVVRQQAARTTHTTQSFTPPAVSTRPVVQPVTQQAYAPVPVRHSRAKAARHTKAKAHAAVKPKHSAARVLLPIVDGPSLASLAHRVFPTAVVAGSQGSRISRTLALSLALLVLLSISLVAFAAREIER